MIIETERSMHSEYTLNWKGKYEKQKNIKMNSENLSRTFRIVMNSSYPLELKNVTLQYLKNIYIYCDSSVENV